MGGGGLHARLDGRTRRGAGADGVEGERRSSAGQGAENERTDSDWTGEACSHGRLREEDRMSSVVCALGPRERCHEMTREARAYDCERQLRYV